MSKNSASCVHRVSGRQYDLFFISLSPQGRQEFKDVIDPKNGLIPEICKNLMTEMEYRCKAQNSVYGECEYSTGDHNELWRNTGANGKYKNECWKRYTKSHDVVEHDLPTFAATFGRVDLTAIFQVPGQFWSRHVCSLLTADPRVASAVSIPIHRYKIAHFRNDQSIFERDLHRYRFQKPFVLVSFIRLADPTKVLPYCNWVANESGLVKWKDLNPKYRIIFNDGNEFAIKNEEIVRIEAIQDINARENARKQFGDEISRIDPHRTEVFLSLMDTAQIVVKSEFDNMDTLIEYVTKLRSDATDKGGSSIEIKGTESVLSLNRESKLWSDPIENDIGKLAHSLSFRVLLKYRNIRGKSPMASLTKIKKKLDLAKIKQQSFGAMPQYYEYCTEWAGITKVNQINTVYESLLELIQSDPDLDVVTIPVIDGYEFKDTGVGTQFQTIRKTLEIKGGQYQYPPAINFPEPYAKWLQELYHLKLHYEWLSKFLAETRSTIHTIFSEERWCNGTLKGIEDIVGGAEKDIKLATDIVQKLGEGYDDNRVFEECFPVAEECVISAQSNLNLAEIFLDLLQDILHDYRDLESILAMSVTSHQSGPTIVPPIRTHHFLGCVLV